MLSEVFEEEHSKDKKRKCLKFSNCMKCPSNGNCDDDGILTCSPSYIRRRDDCLENQKVVSSANKALYELQTFLMNQ